VIWGIAKEKSVTQVETNLLARELGTICREHVLEEKLLLAPSLRTGYQWLDAVALAGQPVLNARVTSLLHLALELAAPAMDRDGLTFLRGLAEEVVTARVFASLKKQAKAAGYLTSLEASPGLIRTLRSTLADLRLAGLNSKRLKVNSFEVEAKGREIASLLALYETELASGRLIDYAGMLGLATLRLREKPAALPLDALVLAPQDLVEEWRGLERELWEVIPEPERLLLQVDQPLESTEIYDTMKIFSATGEVNEVREVLRRCAEGAIPFDQVEILHTDTETYVPLIYEIASRLEREDDESIPVTFAEGIPTRYARPARALAGWLAWQREEHAQSTLVRIIQDGLLKLGTSADASASSAAVEGEPEPVETGFSFTRLSAILRALPIGNDRRRYLPVIREEIASLERRVTSHEAGESEEEEEDAELLARRIAHLHERMRALGVLRNLVEELLALVPEKAGQLALLQGAAAFLTICARCVNRFDAYSLKRLLEEVEEMHGCLEGGEVEGLDVRSWLEGLSTSVRVEGQGPRPGCIFVNNLLSGGHSGRPHTFIIGLDDTRFPGAGLQDPLLLDSERNRLPGQLPTATWRLALKEERFARLLARLRGNITICYNCRDLTDDREKFPSPVVLSAWRIVSGKFEGDQAALTAWLPPPSSFAPDSPGRCIDTTEWWLWRLCGDEVVADAQNVVARSFPHLGRGFEARDARRSSLFTAYDGYVPAAGTTCDPCRLDGPILSSSRLEALGKCPLGYFFRYVLGIEPPEEFAVDPAVWLDPLEQGNLLHHVFREFLERLRSKGLLPERIRDSGLLLEILEAEIARWKHLKPPPNPETCEREARELRRTARIFLANEEEFCRASRPVFLEACIGLAPEGPGTPLDVPAPLEIIPCEGLRIRARGRIDRVDDVSGGSANSFTIWDYKTGSDSLYEQGDPFRGGRRIQPLLYLELLRQRLQEIYPGAQIEGFGYFFPARRARRERYFWKAGQLEGGREIIASLCEMLAAGCFPFSDDEKDARYSDHLPAFGDIAAAARDTLCKLDNPDNVALRPFRRLRGYE
jgi:ATP-dependent helicase/nuclease subunit B